MVVANSFDVSVDRLPNQAMTLEDYRRVGGAVVAVQPYAGHEYETNTITGGNVKMPGGSHSIMGTTTRANHAIIVDPRQ